MAAGDFCYRVISDVSRTVDSVPRSGGLDRSDTYIVNLIPTGHNALNRKRANMSDSAVSYDFSKFSSDELDRVYGAVLRNVTRILRVKPFKRRSTACWSFSITHMIPHHGNKSDSSETIRLSAS